MRATGKLEFMLKKKKKKKLGVISNFPPTKQHSGLQENTLYCDLRWGEGNFPSLKCYFFPLETSYDQSL